MILSLLEPEKVQKHLNFKSPLFFPLFPFHFTHYFFIDPLYVFLFQNYILPTLHILKILSQTLFLTPYCTDGLMSYLCNSFSNFVILKFWTPFFVFSNSKRKLIQHSIFNIQNSGSPNRLKTCGGHNSSLQNV